MSEPDMRCPKCGGVEWFPGAACFHCGWEGSAADAYDLLTKRLEAAERVVDEARRVVTMQSGKWGWTPGELRTALDEYDKIAASRTDLTGKRILGPKEATNPANPGGTPNAR